MKSKKLLALGLALTLAVAAGAILAWQSFRSSEEDPNESGIRSAVDELSLVQRTIVLGEHKRSIAGIATEQVRRATLQLTRTLPARITYDDTQHVSLRTPTDGILESVLVKPGDNVNEGQAVAVLRSPAIGQARNEILRSQTNWQLALKAYEWQTNVHSGVVDLMNRIRQGEAVDSIERQIKDRTLGDEGGQILAAYSKWKLANEISRSLEAAGGSGAISGRVVKERQNDSQQRHVELVSAMEQANFRTTQSLAEAKAQVDAAERDVRIAEQSLAALLGSSAWASNELDHSSSNRDASQVTIRSPLSGTIERRVYSASERVRVQDELFVIADTTRLWVEADIRGRDWDAISVSDGDTVMVTTPSMNQPPQRATVYFLGRQVDPATGAIPLVAQIDNSTGRFRPGMFARVAAPAETLENVLVVSETALVDLDGAESVFIEREDGFVPIAVEVGARSSSLVEILHGLNEGQTVVVAGAFTLKSEWLLESEE